mgnify:CR=1 FL=1
MITSIELQVISKILTSDSQQEIDDLCAFDPSYYSVFKPQIEYILNHRAKYNTVPDIFTFQAEFPDITLVTVNEPFEFISQEMQKNKQHIILLETFNKIKDLGSGDVTEAWQYIANQCEIVSQLDSTEPMDIVKDARVRAEQIVEFNKQQRIPTGFDEIDKLMYGGLSTVEELLLIVARTNTGKSWVCTRMMESAQKNGFPVLYYSPEMQSSFLGTRFDTWRGHFQNSKLYQGKYDKEYMSYIDKLSNEETPAFIVEDKDMSDGVVNVNNLSNLIRKHGIKLLIIDGLSYMEDVKRSDTDYVKYKNLCTDLFRLSKRYGCAVVVAVQANRETRESKDDKVDPMPNLYNIEGSDHPGRICTQAFSLRQIFDKHVLDIRLEKSRIANNQKPILSYAWDPNTGSMQYLPGGEDDPTTNAVNTIQAPNFSNHQVGEDDVDMDFEEEVEF